MEQLSLKEILANKAEVIRLKKAQVKFTDALKYTLPHGEGITVKADANGTTDTNDIIYRTIVGNTYLWMDSHDDVHIPGIFTKSINENEKSILHLHDHLYRLTAKVGSPQKVYEKEINWTDLGVAKAGFTTALLMDTAIKKGLNTQIFEMYKDNEINQHSVGMSYVKLALAVNDQKEKEEFNTWNKYINLIGNQDKALSKGYFWAVTEAKLFEISAVIAGSNELTPTLQPKLFTVEEVAEKSKPAIDYKFLINNF